MVSEHNVKLLLVEDEALIALTLEEVLGEAGFGLDVVHNGRDGEAALQRSAAEYKCLITDVRLPIDGPNGFELGQLARRLSPDIAIIYMSGDAAIEWKANGVPKSIMLQKPFAVAQLVTAVSNLLNDAPLIGP
jgi:two-component system cell cycle response regulator CpdR